MELRCPNCGAYYKKKVAEWVSSVQCSYCDTVILIPKKEMNPQASKVVYVEGSISKPQKTFCLSEFAEFMRKKGYLLDPVSGMLKMGPAVVCISENGIAEGSEPFRTRAEKWITDYMKT